MQFRTGRRGLLILGMHRSGTSALTRVVNLLGARLAADLVPPACDNPLGFWESSRAIALNEAFMGEIGLSPDGTDRVPPEAFRSDAATGFTRKICDFLEQEFGDATLFALKDPRMARLTPLWIAAMREFGAEISFILPLRPAAEVARSLKAREAIPADHSTLLWLRYLLDAERASRNFPRAFVEYSALASDWRGEVERIAQRLDLAWPKRNTTSAAEIDGFLHPIRAADAAGRQVGDRLALWADEVYQIHRAATLADIIDSERLDVITAELDRAEMVYGPRLARTARVLEEERSRVAHLSATVTRLEAELTHARMQAEQSETEARARRDEASALAVAEHARQAAEYAARAEETAQSLERSQGRMADLEQELVEVRAAAAEADAQWRRELVVRDGAVADLQARVAELEAGIEASKSEGIAALEAQVAIHREASAARADEHAKSLAAAVHGEQALGERLLEVLAETRRVEARAQRSEEELQALTDELLRARHEVRSHEARARSEALRRAEESTRARRAYDELSVRLSVADEALRAQGARVDLILGSRSWALTRPIRGLGRATRKLLGGGA